MGLLDLTFDVWAECYSCKRIPRQELGTCKHHFQKLENSNLWKRILIHTMLSFIKMSILQVPANSTESLGVSILKSRGIFPEAHWYWLGVGATVGYIFLFNFLFTLALAYLNRKHLIQSSIYIILNNICYILI